MSRAALYARVSTKDQTTENQLIELRRMAAAKGFEPVEFVDHGFSGKLEIEKRPAMFRMMEEVRRRKFKAVIVWDLSRFARSTRQLVMALDEFRDLGVDFISYQQNIDSTTATGRMMFGMVAVIAEFERELIRERVMSGLQRAKAQGKKLGPPTISNRKKKKQVDPKLISAGIQNGLSYRDIADELGIGKSTVERYANRGLSHKPPSETPPIIVGEGS